METSTKHLRDLRCPTSQGPNYGTFCGRPQDVGHKCFINSTHKHTKLYFDILLKTWMVNGNSEKYFDTSNETLTLARISPRNICPNLSDGENFH